MYRLAGWRKAGCQCLPQTANRRPGHHERVA
nr:MAG TPA: hypothetical protein [Caudoviricetes sp.]